MSSKLPRNATAIIIDNLLRFIATGGVITAALIAPNSVQILDKPVQKLFKSLDEQSKERELRRTIYYMKRKGLIKYPSKEYEHGISLTKEGRTRISEKRYASLAIVTPKNWDRKWRLVFFDIPLKDNPKRFILTSKLKRMGFQQLQKSIWIHPFPCRDEMEIVVSKINVRKYVTYIEVTHIDADEKLQKRFNKLLGAL